MASCRPTATNRAARREQFLEFERYHVRCGGQRFPFGKCAELSFKYDPAGGSEIRWREPD